MHYRLLRVCEEGKNRREVLLAKNGWRVEVSYATACRYVGEVENGCGPRCYTVNSSIAGWVQCLRSGKKKVVSINPESRELAQAADLLEEFSGHEARYQRKVSFKMPSSGLTIGKCEGILYRARRDGKVEHYIHRFKSSAQPDLVASFNGKQLLLVGGSYTFTPAGIVDS